MNKEISSIIEKLRNSHKELYLIDTSFFSVAPSLMVIKPLSRRDFNFYNGLIDTEDGQNAIVRKCLLYPEEIPGDYLAGIDEALCKAIISISGFLETKDLIEGINRNRKYAETLEACITMFICKAFPNISPSNVDDMSFEEIMKYAALSEQILQVEIPYDTFLNPPKPKKKKVYAPPPPPGYESYQTTNTEPEETKETVITKSNLFESQKELNSFIG